MTLMVFKAPGPEKIHGYMVQYKVVDESEVSEFQADGWYLTAIEAGEAEIAAEKAASTPTPTPAPVEPAAEPQPTRAELEQKATELDIKFDGRTSDKKLADLIAATLEQ